MEFVDVLWIGNNLKAPNGMQRVHNVSVALPGVASTPRFLQGRPNSNMLTYLGLHGCLMSNRVSGSIPGSVSVRVDLA